MGERRGQGGESLQKVGGTRGQIPFSAVWHVLA